MAAYVGLGGTLIGESRPREALAAYRRAAEIDGKSAEAWDGLAKALTAVGRNKDAGAARVRSAELRASLERRRHEGERGE